MSKKDCKHENFRIHVDVSKFRDDKVVTNHVAEFTVNCQECDLPFRFVGLPEVESFEHPSCSPGDHYMLFAPIEPVDQSSPWPKAKKAKKNLRGLQ
jgi:hypothetical protein